MSISLSVACALSDRTASLFTGAVSIEGCDSTFIDLSAEEGFFRAFSNREFDVAELSFGSYLVSLASGRNDYVALPVFTSRSFRHGAIYTRADGVTHPAELRGCRVGVPEYQMTAAIWVRGMLEQDFGVAASDISWVTGGLHQPGRSEKVSAPLNADIQLSSAPVNRCLSDMLKDGEIDALISPRIPACFQEPGSGIRRLFADPAEAEANYYRNHRLFPIMHLLGIRKDKAQEHRWLPRSIYKGFEASRIRGKAALEESTSLASMLPWLSCEVLRTKSIMGEDYWPYGVARNRSELEALCRFAFDQGLLSRNLAIEELFAPGTYEEFKV